MASGADMPYAREMDHELEPRLQWREGSSFQRAVASGVTAGLLASLGGAWHFGWDPQLTAFVTTFVSGVTGWLAALWTGRDQSGGCALVLLPIPIVLFLVGLIAVQGLHPAWFGLVPIVCILSFWTFSSSPLSPLFLGFLTLWGGLLLELGRLAVPGGPPLWVAAVIPLLGLATGLVPRLARGLWAGLRPHLTVRFWATACLVLGVLGVASAQWGAGLTLLGAGCFLWKSQA